MADENRASVFGYYVDTVDDSEYMLRRYPLVDYGEAEADPKPTSLHPFLPPKASSWRTDLSRTPPSVHYRLSHQKPVLVNTILTFHSL